MSNTILTPNKPACQQETATQATEEYLVKDNNLSDVTSVQDARTNLNVYSKDDVLTKDEVTSLINQIQNLLKALNTQVETNVNNISDINSTLDDKANKADIIGLAKTTDVSKDIKNAIIAHSNQSDVHNIKQQIVDALAPYVLSSDVYSKSKVYTKAELNILLNNYTKKDGSTPFVGRQIGLDPTADSHLSTKRYVDNKMLEHVAEIDPHGFLDRLNNRLRNYYTKSQVYTKAETYSRSQIDSIIQDLVNSELELQMNQHLAAEDPHGTLAKVKAEKYVKSDGSVPFTNPQKGVEAVDDEDLVIKKQLDDQLETLDQRVVWKTSGPVQTTVGFVEDNSELPETMSFQGIMDAIFYGKQVNIEAPEYAAKDDIVPVKVIIHGPLDTIDSVDIYQNGVLLATIAGSDIPDDGIITVNSKPIQSDTTWKAVVHYLGGIDVEATATTKLAFNVFVGILPKWFVGNTITWDYVKQLIKDDPTNNKLYVKPDSLTELKHTYNFETPTVLQELCILIPTDYPDLKDIITPAQSFDVDAFEVLNAIPIEGTLYKLYTYSQPLVKLNLTVTYKF